MRIEQKHQQTVTVGILSERRVFTVNHVQEQVAPMSYSERVAVYTAQTGSPRVTPRQFRQLRKAAKRAQFAGA